MLHAHTLLSKLLQIGCLYRGCVVEEKAKKLRKKKKTLQTILSLNARVLINVDDLGKAELSEPQFPHLNYENK